MIVRDEAAFIGGCLLSLRDHVDEIVVVDTGSVDETPSMAAELGAKVFQFTWIDDFAAARNFALDVATGDWALYIDADERLVAPDGMSLADELADPGLAALRLRFQPRVGFSDYREMRLFRRDPRVRFVGRIHETMVPAVYALCEQEGLSVGLTDIRIVHLGYEGDQAHKHRRNLPLLQQAVIENPSRVYYWWHLGSTLAAMSRFEEADEAWQRATAIVQPADEDQRHAEASLAYEGRAAIALDHGDAVQALSLADEGLARRASDCSLRMIRARALVALRRESEALEVVDGLLAAGKDGTLDPVMSFDLRIFGEFAYELRGLACFRLGRFAEAADAYSRAAELSGGDLSYRAKAAAAAGRARAAGS
jgi:tetratricopeptide (TPR) repeat protein